MVGKRVRFGDEGFSLIEVMIASAMFILIISTVLSSLDSGTKSERISAARQEALVSLRQSMTQMTKDVRQAISVDGSSNVSRLDIQTLQDGIQEHVVYDVVGTPPHAILRRSVNGSTPVTLTDRIDAPQAFCYQYDNPNCLATTPAATVSSIRIALTLNPVVFGAGSVTLASEIAMRNLSTN